MTTAGQSRISGSVATGQKFAVLLLAHGTPETVDEIPEYLKNVVSGRAIPQHVVEEIQSRYAQIGKSPLTKWTLEQAALLEQKIGLPVYVGMRNWKPYIGDTVRRMQADGVTDAVAICLAPQNSRTSVGLYRRAAYAEAGTALRFHFIEAWADHPRLADAFADRLLPAWQDACRVVGAKVPVLFTAHSVPCRTIQVAAASGHATQAQAGPDVALGKRGEGPRRYLIFASSSADCGGAFVCAAAECIQRSRSLRSRGQTYREPSCRTAGHGRTGFARLVFRISKPGNVRWSVDWPHG